ncbi:MAG: hypothetical protein ABFC78_02490 [Methanoregula sp.]
MEIGYSGRQITITEKYTTLLDKFVLDFVHILETETPYVIVSGYVAILFGRSRGTEDIDILIPAIPKDQFIALHKTLLDRGYEFLNAESCEGLYEMLVNRMGIRISQKDQFIPNIELKMLKDDIDRIVLRDRLKVCIDKDTLFISPIEIQIAYKLFLGSEKDIEDALYLWEIFGSHLDKEDMKIRMNQFRVTGQEYGIII